MRLIIQYLPVTRSLLGSGRDLTTIILLPERELVYLPGIVPINLNHQGWEWDKNENERHQSFVTRQS